MQFDVRIHVIQLSSDTILMFLIQYFFTSLSLNKFGNTKIVITY